MAVFLVQSFVQYIPIRVSRFYSLTLLSNSIDNRLSFSTKASEDATDEILNKMLAAGDDPSVSREQFCIDYIRKLCAAGNYQLAARLPQNLRGKHIFVGSRAYNYILEAAEGNCDIDIISDVFKDLLVSGGLITLISYIVVARAFGKHNNRAVLLNFIREVCKLELQRPDIVLNRFIFALAKCGHAEDALFVFDNMKSLKCKPDLVTYNTVLAILGRSRRLDDMLRVFASMKSVDIVPDIVTYNTVLNILQKMGRIDLCLVHFKEMSERGIQPDLLTFKALIESLGRSGNIEAALKVFDEMKCRQIQPSIHIYRALIFSLKKMGKMELAMKFSVEMNNLFSGSFAPCVSQYKKK